jgi:two-component system, chemotaxis family, chemotaxis protein CheY
MIKTILVVDDSPVMRQLLKISLHRIDLLGIVDVIEAVNGIDAYRKFESNQVNFLITDMDMPKMNGLELIEKLRSLPNGKSIPIIVITASSNDSDLKTAIELGANDYLYKPISIPRLRDAISKLIDFNPCSQKIENPISNHDQNRVYFDSGKIKTIDLPPLL